MILEFPFPPSVNHYLGRHGNRTYKTAKAKAYNQAVWDIVKLSGADRNLNTPLLVYYFYWFPDLRKRDIANYEKVLTDSMVTAGVMTDDHLIHKLVQEKKGVVKGGKVQVVIYPYLPHVSIQPSP